MGDNSARLRQIPAGGDVSGLFALSFNFFNKITPHIPLNRLRNSDFFSIRRTTFIRVLSLVEVVGRERTFRVAVLFC